MMESNETSKWDKKREADTSGGGSGPNIALIGALIVVALAVVFFFQNSHGTVVTFLFFDTHTRVRSAIIVSVVAGILLDRLISFWWRRRKRGSDDR